MKRVRVLLTTVALVFACALTNFADSWALPEAKKYYSENKEYYLEVIPTKLESQLKYFEDKVNKKDRPGAKEGEKDNYCKGVLYKRANIGGYEQVWSIHLSNEVAPVNALVSNDGQYAVTFDNWHLMGSGDNVVVIYAQNGRLIRKLSLENVFSKEEIMKLPRSVSSIYWGGKHSIDEKNDLLILRIVSKWSGSFDDEPELRDLKVELQTGRIIR